MNTTHKKKHSKEHGNYIYYQPYCKICAKNKTLNRRMKNHERYKESMRRYHKNNTTYERKAKDRKHAREQKESGYKKEYYKRNKEYFLQYNKNRKMNKTHEITEKEWASCKSYFHNSCAYCGLQEDDHYIIYKGELRKTDLHKEHVVHDGSNGLDNCVPSCRDCNSSKWAFKLEEWYTENNPFYHHYSHEKLVKISKWLNEDYKLYIK